MKSFIPTLIIFILSGAAAYAQKPAFTDAEKRFEAHLSGEVYMPPVLYAGSPWFLADWNKGSVTLKTGETVSNVLLRYNGYMDELFWLTPESYDHIRLDKQLISSFVIHRAGSKQQFRFRNMNIRTLLGTSRESVFMQVLYEGDVSLYVFRKIRETGATTSVMVGNVLVPRQVIGSDYRYYLRRGGSEPELIIPNRSSLLRAFPEHRQEIRQALRRNRNRMRNEAQFVEAIVLLNRIIAAEK